VIIPTGTLNEDSNVYINLVQYKLHGKIFHTQNVNINKTIYDIFILSLRRSWFWLCKLQVWISPPDNNREVLKEVTDMKINWIVNWRHGLTQQSFTRSERKKKIPSQLPVSESIQDSWDVRLQTQDTPPLLTVCSYYWLFHEVKQTSTVYTRLHDRMCNFQNFLLHFEALMAFDDLLFGAW